MIIYRATNKITRDFYIGKTRMTLAKRISGHIQQVRRGDGDHFHNALRKYGLDAFHSASSNSAPDRGPTDGCHGHSASQRFHAAFGFRLSLAGRVRSASQASKQGNDTGCYSEIFLGIERGSFDRDIWGRDSTAVPSQTPILLGESTI